MTREPAGRFYGRAVKSLVAAVAAVLLTAAVFGTIYLVAQTIERQGADDAPDRLASQVAADPSAATEAPFDLGRGSMPSA